MLISRCKYLYLAYFSKPRGDRAIYRAIQQRKSRKILEIGLGLGDRALRMIGLAQRAAAGEQVRYAAIDPFEARGPEHGPGLALKEAHRILKATEAHVQLIPGDAASTLARVANSLQNLDLIIISSQYDDAALESAWFYVPRMLHAGSVVIRQQSAGEGDTTALMTMAQIEALSQAPRRRRAA